MKFNIFKLGIFPFNLCVYYLTRGFIASIRAFNLPASAFNLATRAFILLTREFELVTRVLRFTFPRDPPVVTNHIIYSSDNSI